MSDFDYQTMPIAELQKLAKAGDIQALQLFTEAANVMNPLFEVYAQIPSLVEAVSADFRKAYDLLKVAIGSIPNTVGMLQEATRQTVGNLENIFLQIEHEKNQRLRTLGADYQVRLKKCKQRAGRRTLTQISQWAQKLYGETVDLSNLTISELDFLVSILVNKAKDLLHGIIKTQSRNCLVIVWVVVYKVAAKQFINLPSLASPQKARPQIQATCAPNA